MFSVIIVPDGCRGQEEQHRLEPGQTLRFGRTAPAGSGLTLSHPAVPCAAGEITATGAFWTLTNFSRDQTYVVANPEGAGEHIRVAPGRADAPVPFEFARVTLCGTEPRPGCGFDVMAPRHDYLTGGDGAPGPGGAVFGGAGATGLESLDGSGGPNGTGDVNGVHGLHAVDAAGGADGAGAAGDAEDWRFDPFPLPYPLDHTCRYFLVLAALCEAGLRTGDAAAPVPTVEELTERLRPVWPEVSPSAVSWNIDYLRLKLRLRAPEDDTATREALSKFALRFDLVHEGHLGVLAGQLV
ncbi:hypothetical protein [Streptomyces axinellae]|uniref:FHA domain-containing protein n=1 Tax=Streptomyces axinellae TaxID=552788 RepID=A0ABP6D772_9ACTN